MLDGVSAFHLYIYSTEMHRSRHLQRGC